jgi:hypothetical protein
MSTPSYTQAAIGWIFMLGATYGVYYYYTRDANGRAKRRTTRLIPVEGDPNALRTPKRRDRVAGHTSDSASGNNSNLKKKVKSTPVSRPISRTDGRDEPEAEDLSWAQELEKRRKGAAISAPKRADSKQKTVKQSSANKVAADMSGDTSTTGGADADDDFSPSMSPELTATDYEVHVAGNVNDMLEPVAPGPTIIRIVPVDNPTPQRPKKEFKPPQEVESKKQRQNKRKAEERKAQADEIEQIRKKQLEQQRKTAREARGEPAKNGAAPPPAQNAWSQPKAKTATNGTGTGTSTGTGPLLDTFDPRNLSENEQLRIIQENDPNAWTTAVSKKNKSKRKNTMDGSADAGAGSSAESDGINGITNGIH